MPAFGSGAGLQGLGAFMNHGMLGAARNPKPGL